MYSFRRFQPRSGTPNLAPLVDVVMVILIFFMMGTSFAISEGVLPTRLPSDAGPAAGPPSFAPGVRIALSPGTSTDRCRIEVTGQGMTSDSFDALSDFLKRKLSQGADPQGRIVIAAAPAVRYQFVISTLDACVRAGFRNVQFAVGAVEVAGTTTTSRS